MQRFNDLPRPRALLEDLDDEISGRLRKLVPTARNVSSQDRVYEDEYDVLFTASEVVRRAQHMHAVAFGGDFLGPVKVPKGVGADILIREARIKRFHNATLATELVVPSGITDELGELVRVHLIPLFSQMESKPVLKVVSAGGHQATLAHGPQMSEWCSPFLVAGDGNILAAAFVRSGGGLCWVLPSGCPVPEYWAALALKDFRRADPSRVPGLPKWWENSEWATPQQRTAQRAAVHAIEESKRVVKESDERLIIAREAVDEADKAAVAGMTRLLMADGDSLVSAVISALQLIGFEVKNMDDIFPEGQRREDLRVRDPDHPGWESVVEVKGYKRGAAVNDLARLNRWAMWYTRDNGRVPDAMWHIVNAFRETDPAIRAIPIPNDGDLHDFTEDGGLLIDTRQLFAMQCDLELGVANARDLRALLRTSRGRFRR